MPRRVHVAVLADNRSEAAAYAKKAGLRQNQWFFVSEARAIDGRHPTAIHQLPSYQHRRDFHAIERSVKILRWKHNDVEVVEIDPSEVPEVHYRPRDHSTSRPEPVGHVRDFSFRGAKDEIQDAGLVASPPARTVDPGYFFKGVD